MGIAQIVTGIFSGIVKPLLDKFIPDAQQRVEAEQFFYKLIASLDMSQIGINLKEAENPRLFVSGWRPFVGWVCGASLAYSVIGVGLINWTLDVLATFAGHTIPHAERPDLTLVLEVLLGLLGLGSLRTYEKINGVSSK
jgi:hypothetical protein